VTTYPFAIRYAPIEYCNDKEIILTAVSKKGRTLEYASNELKDDYGVVYAAVSNIGFAIHFASLRLRHNYNIIKTAITNDAPITRDVLLPHTMTKKGRLLRFASDELRSNREIVLAAVLNDGSALGWASKEFYDDREIVLAAVKNDAAAFCWASPRLKKDWEILHNTIAHNYNIAFCIEGLLSNAEIVHNIFTSSAYNEVKMLQSVRIHPNSLKHPAFVRKLYSCCYSWELREKYGVIFNLPLNDIIIDDIIKIVKL